MMSFVMLLLIGASSAVGYGLEVAIHHPRHLRTAFLTFFSLGVLFATLWVELLLLSWATLYGSQPTPMLFTQLLSAAWPLTLGFARVTPLSGPGAHAATRALAVGTVAAALSTYAAATLPVASALSLATFGCAYLVTWTLYAFLNRTAVFRETRWAS